MAESCPWAAVQHGFGEGLHGVEDVQHAVADHHQGVARGQVQWRTAARRWPAQAPTGGPPEGRRCAAAACRDVQRKPMAGVDIADRAGRGVQAGVEQGDERVGGIQVRGDGLAGGGEGSVQVLAVPMDRITARTVAAISAAPMPLPMASANVRCRPSGVRYQS